MKIVSVKAIGMRWECPVMSDAMSVCRVRQALWIKIETDKNYGNRRGVLLREPSAHCQTHCGGAAGTGCYRGGSYRY